MQVQQVEIDSNLANLRQKVEPEADPVLANKLKKSKEKVIDNEQVIRLLSRNSFEEAKGFAVSW